MSEKDIKTFNSLIKIHENELNALKRKLNSLAAQREELQQTITNMLNQAELEAKSFTGGEYAFMLDNYLQNVEQNRQKLSTQISGLDKEIELLHKELIISFGELKKFDIAKQNRMQLNEENAKQSEIKMLDELSGLISQKKLKKA